MPKLELFDTHCHTHEMVRPTTPVYEKWYSDGEDRTPESVLTAAHEAGVNRMLCIGTTQADSQLAIEFVAGRENLWASIGIHPHETVSHRSTEVKAEFARLLEDGPRGAKIKAIGECGLDYFYSHSPREAQLDLLKFQIELALEHNLPLSFHVREAFDDFWPLFDSYRGAKIRGVLHSFTDTPANMEQAVKRELFLGVNGIATFTKNDAQLVTYRTIPQHLLLLETDAPFLTPKPFRGKVCESKHVRTTAEFVAGLREQSLEDVAASTTANARTLFAV